MYSRLHALSFRIILLHLLAFSLFAKELPAQGLYYKKEVIIPASSVTGSSEIQTLDGGMMRLLESHDSIGPLKNLTLIKMNGTGVVSWYRHLAATYSYGAANIVQSPDSGYFVCCIGSNAAYTMFKTDKDGVMQFSNQVNLPSGYSVYSLGQVKAKNDGGFYITASVLEGASSNEMWHLLEIDGDGNISSSNCYNMLTGKNRVHDVDTCSNGDVIMLGSVWAPNALHAAALTRVDATGAIVWSKVFPCSLNMLPVDLIRSDGDFIYVLGQTSFSSGPQTGLMKLDGNGNELWTLNYSASFVILRPLAMDRTTGGDILITGEEMFIKTDSSGVPLCARFYPGLTLYSVFDLTPQIYRLSGIPGHAPRSVVITTDSCGYTCEDSALSVTKTPYNVTDSTITGFMPLPVTRIAYGFMDNSTTLQYNETCAVTGIATVAQASFVQLMPNPANDHLLITSASAITMIEIFDVNGALVHSQAVNAPACTVETTNISSGIYFVRVLNATQVSTFKAIIAR